MQSTPSDFSAVFGHADTDNTIDDDPLLAGVEVGLEAPDFASLHLAPAAPAPADIASGHGALAAAPVGIAPAAPVHIAPAAPAPVDIAPGHIAAAGLGPTSMDVTN